MQTIPLSSIILPSNRQRKTFDVENIDELRHSILTYGLMHPIVLRDDKCTLVAGERRLRAIRSIYGSGLSFSCNGQLIERGLVPFICLTDLDELSVREAELEENIRRIDLPWQEREIAISELDKLRIARNPNQTKIESASEIFPDYFPAAAVKALSKANILADHMHIAEVRNAQSPGAALRVVKQLASTQGKSEATGTTISKHTLLHGDAAEHMQSFSPHSFELILTDPPYGMGADNFKFNARSHRYDTEGLEAYELLATDGQRVLVPDGAMFAFIHITRFAETSDIFKRRNWKVFPTPIIWFKSPSTTGFMPWGTRGPRRRYEAILYASKADRPLIRSFGDVIECAPVENATHPAEKPSAIYRFLLDQSLNAGARVLDPFCGTGPIFPAASELGMIATGIEQDENWISVAKGKMK